MKPRDEVRNDQRLLEGELNFGLRVNGNLIAFRRGRGRRTHAGADHRTFPRTRATVRNRADHGPEASATNDLASCVLRRRLGAACGGGGGGSTTI